MTFFGSRGRTWIFPCCSGETAFLKSHIISWLKWGDMTLVIAVSVITNFYVCRETSLPFCDLGNFSLYTMILVFLFFSLFYWLFYQFFLAFVLAVSKLEFQ